MAFKHVATIGSLGLISLFASNCAEALLLSCQAPSQQQTFTNTDPPGTTTGVIQSVVLPGTSVTIDAAGAQGGYSGGLGAEVSATFSVTANSTLCVLVGNAGGTDNAGSGGGGSFVYLIQSGTCTSNLPNLGTSAIPQLLIAAAGGGGSGFLGFDSNPATTNGVAPTGAGASGASAGITGDYGGGHGGTGGTGGGAVFNSGGGGGLFTGGGSANTVQGGLALIAGANGGAYPTYSNGGFGGGGASAGLGGGGGGYNGGGAGGDTGGAANDGAGGGGGSFSATTPIAQSGAQSGNGSVTICYSPAVTVAPSVVALPISRWSEWVITIGLIGIVTVITKRRARRQS